jgi:hypothetical protein
MSTRVRLVKAFDAIQYDGTNAQEILDAMDPDKVSFYQMVLTGESGGEAHFTWNTGIQNSTMTWHTGDWLPVGSPNDFTCSPFASGDLGPYVVVG